MSPQPKWLSGFVPLAGKYLAAKPRWSWTARLLIMIRVRLLSTTLFRMQGPHANARSTRCHHMLTAILKHKDAELDYISGINEISRCITIGFYAALRYGVFAKQDRTRIGVQTSKMSLICKSWSIYSEIRWQIL